MLILAAILAIFVYGMTAAMLGTILPDLSARFHLTPKQNGTIAFCQALGLILASIGVGPLIDYEGKKVGLVLGLALSALAVALLPRSNGFRAIASRTCFCSEPAAASSSPRPTHSAAMLTRLIAGRR